MAEYMSFSIGEAAAASGVSIKAIRYYEQIGLIPKAPRRANTAHGNGHRVFSARDVGRLKFIHHARLLGLALAEIRQLVALAEDSGCPGHHPEYQAVFARHLDAITRRIDQLAQLRRTIETFMQTDPAPSPRHCTWEACDCLAPEPPSQE